MVGLQTLDLAIGVRVPASQPNRFKQFVPAKQTVPFLRTLVTAWKDNLDEERIHPVLAMTAWNLDFLCIHPFRDGNGRVSRLLLSLMCYQLGFELGRYISLERLIEENKDGIVAIG